MIGAFCIGGLLLVTDVVVEYLLPYFVRGQSVQTFTSLSGRTEFWPEVIKKVGEAPFLGHGFYASQRMMWNISSVDNTYLEVMLGLGVMGLIVFCVPVYTIVYNLWKSRPWRAGFDLASDSRFLWVQLLALFFFLFFRSLTGPSFQNLHVNLAIFVLVLVSTHRLRKMAMLREKQDKRVQDSDK
jgi:O-antigen ligase